MNMTWREQRKERKLDRLYGLPRHYEKGDRVFVGGIANVWATVDTPTLGERVWLVWGGPRNTPLFVPVVAMFAERPY